MTYIPYAPKGIIVEQAVRTRHCHGCHHKIKPGAMCITAKNFGNSFNLCLDCAVPTKKLIRKKLEY